jgi:hypothetical protein
MTYGGTHGAADYAGRSVEFGSREFFEQADQRLYSWNKPEVVQAAARKLPFEDGQFDYVYSWGVLHLRPILAGQSPS